MERILRERSVAAMVLGAVAAAALVLVAAGYVPGQVPSLPLPRHTTMGPPEEPPPREQCYRVVWILMDPSTVLTVVAKLSPEGEPTDAKLRCLLPGSGCFMPFLLPTPCP